MPGDLRDPEQSIPWYYDNKYDNPYEQADGPVGMNKYLQAIAMDVLGEELDTDGLEKLKHRLESRGIFHRNPGDESFRNTVRDLLMARKVASQWLS